MKEAISTQAAFTLADLLKILGEVRGDPDTVHFEGADFVRVREIEETLTDGSKVTNVQITAEVLG